MRVLTASLSLALLLGCAAPPPPEPADTTLVDQLGKVRAQKRLSALLKRSVKPSVTSVEHDETGFSIVYWGESMKVSKRSSKVKLRMENRLMIDYANVKRVVLEENEVSLLGPGERELIGFEFAGGADANSFRNLVASLKASRENEQTPPR